MKYNYIFTQKCNLYFWYFDIFKWKYGQILENRNENCSAEETDGKEQG